MRDPLAHQPVVARDLHLGTPCNITIHARVFAVLVNLGWQGAVHVGGLAHHVVTCVAATLAGGPLRRAVIWRRLA